MYCDRWLFPCYGFKYCSVKLLTEMPKHKRNIYFHYKADKGLQNYFETSKQPQTLKQPNSNPGSVQEQIFHSAAYFSPNCISVTVVCFIFCSAPLFLFVFTHFIEISLRIVVITRYFKMTFHMTVLLEPNKCSLSNASWTCLVLMSLLKLCDFQCSPHRLCANERMNVG